MPSPSSPPGRRGAVDATVLGAFGARIELRGPEGPVGEVEELAGPALTVVGRAGGPADARVTVTHRPPRSSVAVSSLGEVVVHDVDPADLVRRALSELHLAVAVHAREALFVHAGAVAWQGRGIVIPGRSMTGKSTLVRALVEAGAEYYSDEYAVLDPLGRLHPYPKPLSIRCGDGSTRHVAPRSLGPVGERPVDVGLVLSTRFVDGAPWRPERVRGAAATLPLVDNTVVARLDPERMLDAVAAVASRAVCVRGARPDAREAAVRILSLAQDVAGRTVAGG